MATQTARQVLTRAMRRIRQIAGEEPMSAAELADGLVTMNGAMHGFGPKGIHYSHVDLAANDTVNMPDEQIDNLIWMIAQALAPEYGYVFATADEKAALLGALQELQAAYHITPPAPSPRGLLRNRLGLFSMQRGE